MVRCNDTKALGKWTEYFTGHDAEKYSQCAVANGKWANELEIPLKFSRIFSWEVTSLDFMILPRREEFITGHAANPCPAHADIRKMSAFA